MDILGCLARLRALLRSSLLWLCRCFRALVNCLRVYVDNYLNYTMKKSESDFDIEYDSTWEDEDDSTETSKTKTPLRWAKSARRNIYAAKDMQDFRRKCLSARCDDDYSSDELDQEQSYMPNVEFYQHKERSVPDGVFIKDYWNYDHRQLERDHLYIQWLFPIQEQGMNCWACPLTTKEIKIFSGDDNMKKTLLESYKLMLDFYGIKLVDEKTGEVDRAEKWKERFDNLNRNTHNNLRITRILKCLGILGFEHYQKPLVMFFLKETLVNRTLNRVKNSALDYFVFAVLNKSERRELLKFAFQKFEPKTEFVWCPKRIQMLFMNQMKHELPDNSKSESNSSINSENTKASCTESSAQPAHEAPGSISHPQQVSEVQNEDELQRVTGQNLSNNIALDNPVPTIRRNEDNTSGYSQDLLNEKMIKHTENTGGAITSKEVLSVNATYICTPEDTKGDSERTVVTQKSVSEVTETHASMQVREQTTTEKFTDENANTEVSGEDCDMSGKGLFDDQSTSMNLQDVTDENSDSYITEDKESDSGLNGGIEHQGSEHPEACQPLSHVTATENGNESETSKDVMDHSVSPFIDDNHLTATEEGITKSNTYNSNTHSDLTAMKCVEPEVPDEHTDRQDTPPSVNESIRTPTSAADMSEVTDDGEACAGNAGMGNTSKMERHTSEMERDTSEMKRYTSEMERDTSEMKRYTSEMDKETGNEESN